MAQNIDLKLRTVDELGETYDISFANGDFELVDNFDTAIDMSLFCERRADRSEVPTPERRRGWWGNELSRVAGFQIGSKLWLLAQARRTQETLNKAISYAQESLQWLIEDNLAEQVVVTGEYLDDVGIRLYITIYRSQSIVESRYYDLWTETKK